MKPSLFTNELLATSDPLYTVIFEGLWCVADREGRLEDRPRKIHMEVNAGRAFEGTESALAWLADNKFITRYEVNGEKYIQVRAFGKHQKPHQNEKPSVIPAQELVTKAPSACDQGTKHLALNPSSLNPHSLNPDSGEEGRAKRSPTAHRIPDGFELTEERKKVAEAEGVNPSREFSKFVDYFRGASGAKARKHDWDATWRNWCRSDFAQRSAGAVARSTWRPTEEDSGPC